MKDLLWNDGQDEEGDNNVGEQHISSSKGINEDFSHAHELVGNNEDQSDFDGYYRS